MQEKIFASYCFGLRKRLDLPIRVIYNHYQLITNTDNDMITVASAQNAIRQSGMRVTPQRLMIVEVLVDNRTHPTVDDIYRLVHDRYPTISLATVYQTLSLLARHGLVLELHGGKDGLRCDPETTPHAHAYCEQCGTVYDIALPTALPWDAQRLGGFQPTTYEVSLFGTCTSCQEHRKE